jgi:hypothetical protein
VEIAGYSLRQGKTLGTFARSNVPLTGQWDES